MNTGRSRITTALVLGAALAAAGCGSARPSSTAPSAATSSPAATHRPASAAALAARLKAAGLPVRGLIVYTAATDPNHELGRQGGYTSKVAWIDRAERAGAGKPLTADERGDVSYGGGIEVFPTAAQARQRAKYLTPAQARAYKAAFTSAMQQ